MVEAVVDVKLIAAPKRQCTGLGPPVLSSCFPPKSELRHTFPKSLQDQECPSYITLQNSQIHKRLTSHGMDDIALFLNLVLIYPVTSRGSTILSTDSNL